MDARPICIRSVACQMRKAGSVLNTSIDRDRRSQIAESSAIVCDHMETRFCDCLRSCDRNRRRSQTIAEDRTMFYLLRSSAIICDRLRSCYHMETKVLQFAIEMYPILFLILTDDSTFLSHKARMFDYSNAHLL